MRLRWPAFLLLCAVSLAMAQEVDQCRQGVDDELIWDYNVRRPLRMGGYQEVETDYGPTDVRITCIWLNSLSENNDGAWITAGGIGYNFVKLKFRSKYSRGLHYRVLVYGRPTLRRGLLRLP